MYRPGTDENDVKMSDVLCDFCRRAWVEGLAMVEGHRGAVICGSCLADAYRALVLGARPAAEDDAERACLLCLQARAGAMWSVPPDEGAAAGPDVPAVCARCVKQAAAVLAKDKDSGWTKPTA